jgi:hypothetical protein
MGAMGGTEMLLPPGATGGAAISPRTGGAGPQTPFAAGGSGAVLRQTAGGPARPIMLPTPEGGYVKLRDPTKIVGQGDDALELRTRTAAEKEKWRLKKNLIIWTFGLLVLGITIIILMFMGPL